MSGFTPTDEQVAIIDACAAGRNLVIEAGAGAGKTSVLKLAAEKMKGRGLYGAFNKAIADEAAAKFPKHVTCKTIHSLAFGQVGTRYKGRLNGPRQPARQVAHLLGIREPVTISDVELYPATIARLAVDAVERFCNSADDEIGWSHVPQINGLTVEDDPEASAAVKRLVMPHAQAIWADLQHTDADGGGLFRFTHSHYRKIYALRKPRLPFDFILLDECQDTSPVVAEMLMAQTHAQLIAVGDAAQAIYGWAGGSMETLDRWPAEERLRLTQSFRFGQQIAAEGNKWLTLLGTDMRISGTGTSVVGPVVRPNAVLCRTNGGAAQEVLRAQKAGTRVALVGGGAAIKNLAEACEDLRAGRATSHPELVAFRDWGEVQDYATHESSGSDLRAFVTLIDNHGSDVVIEAMERLSPESRAQVTVSTAHKAKGREWPTVRIGGDFQEPESADGEPVDPEAEEVRLAYVAVTRAQNCLDVGGLEWIDDHVDQPEKTVKEVTQ
ncbi:hypothetical protein FB384_004933 [Prauserella sediminis]|uniref:DNA 3'-5' helicase n=1 Tax=Prauserella sediminis TaxID=577680 RepID=A0A839XX94_9PSEU|nr:UvrD-helicase domain-containing protein [Prauserella sediminis]MBB3665974.1 hypothetical protein [Prauserella sediminis]